MVEGYRIELDEEENVVRYPMPTLPGFALNGYPRTFETEQAAIGSLRADKAWNQISRPHYVKGREA